MSMALDEALRGVELVSGMTYRCQVGNVFVELRVLPADNSFDITLDTMLDPWVDFPRPKTIKRMQLKKGALPTPDVPMIPAGDDLA